MVCLRESLWSQLQVLEADLRKVPLPQSLLKDLCKAESKWSKIEKCHGTILAVSEGEQAQRSILCRISDPKVGPQGAPLLPTAR